MLTTITAACGGFVAGWLMGRRIVCGGYQPRRGSNPAPPGGKPAATAGPEQPLTARLIRYWDWEREQVQNALEASPVRLDPGRIQRGNGHGGPTGSKPGIIPKPQFPPPRVIQEDFLPSRADTIAAIRAADAAISDQALEAEFWAWWMARHNRPPVQTFAAIAVAWGRHLLSRGMGA